MATVEGFFTKHNSYPSQQQFAALATIVEDGDSNNDSLLPVRCTKKLFSNLVNCADTAVSSKHYDDLCIILSTIRYIVRGSPATTTGFPKLLSFGLAKKISAWCVEVCLSDHQLCRTEGWSKAADDMLFTLTVVINFSDHSKQAMIPLLPILLQCLSSPTLPASAKIEATRGSNCLLEICELSYKSTLVKRGNVKALISKMDELIRKAGDFELQITTLECLFRLTTVAERATLANRWFKVHYPSLLKAFSSIRESFFEVDCRKFLNVLNRSCGQARTVYSVACKKAFLGSFELHQPPDEGLDEFWVDFNMATSNMSLYTKDLGGGAGGGADSDDMWESIIVKNEIVKDWSVTRAGDELSLSVILTVPTHTLLHSLSTSSSSHKIAVTFDLDSDPTYPLLQIFGRGKQLRPSATVSNQKGGVKVCHPVKQSIAIAPILLNPKFKGLKEADNISPIEPTQDSPTGKIVCSQESITPTNHSAPPVSTPATSTPKPHPLRVRPPSSASSSAASRCPPLQFISGSAGTSRPKASQSVSGIVLGKNSRVVQRNTPTKGRGGVSRPGTPAPKQQGRAVGGVNLNGEERKGDCKLGDNKGVQQRESGSVASNRGGGAGASARPIATTGPLINTGKEELKASQQRSKSVADKGGVVQPAKQANKQKSQDSNRQDSAKSAANEPAKKQKLSLSASASKQRCEVARDITPLKQASGVEEGSDLAIEAQVPPAAPLKPPTGNNGGASTQRAGGKQSGKQKASSSKPPSGALPPRAPPSTRARRGRAGQGEDTSVLQSSGKRGVANSEPAATRSATKTKKAETQKLEKSTSLESSVQANGKKRKEDSQKLAKCTSERSSASNGEKNAQKNARAAGKEQSPTVAVELQDSLAEERDDLEDAVICLDKPPPPPIKTRTYYQQLKSSPSAKKQLNTSMSSTCSTASRTALADISNVALNRGGQTRVFNFSAVQQKKGKKCKNQKIRSNCSSLNTTVNSECEPIAIPDSLPLNQTQRSSGKQSTSTSKRKQPVLPKSESLSDVYEYDEELEDSTWELSPPKAKKAKKAPAKQTAKAPTRQAAKAPKQAPKQTAKTRVNPPRAKKPATKPKSNVILSSARTKSKPSSLLSSFDLSLSDDEFKVPKGKPPRYTSKAKTAADTSVISFTELKKRVGKKTNAKAPPLPRAPVTPESPPPPSVSPLGGHRDQPEHAPAHPPLRSGRKRVIDDIYDPHFSLSPQLSPSPSPHAELVTRKRLKETQDSSAGTLDKARGTNSSKKQSSAGKSTIKEPFVTPYSHRVSRDQARRSNQVVDYAVRALLKEFEGEEVEEMQQGDGEVEGESEDSFVEVNMDTSPPPPSSIAQPKIQCRVPQAPKKQFETQPRRTGRDAQQTQARRSSETQLKSSGGETQAQLSRETRPRRSSETQARTSSRETQARRTSETHARKSGGTAQARRDSTETQSPSRTHPPKRTSETLPPSPRRSSGYYSRQSLNHPVISDSGSESEEEGDRRSRSRSGSPRRDHTPSPLRPSREYDDTDITVGFAQICQNLIAQSGKKNRPAAAAAAVKKADSQASKRQPQAQLKKSAGKREVDAPSSVTLTQLSRDIVSNHTSRDSSSAKKKRGGQLQQQVESDVQEHEDDDLDISEESDVELEYGSVANVGDMSAFGPLRAPSEAGHYSSNEEGGEEGEGEEGEGEGSSAESSQELRSRNIGAEMQALMSTIRDSLTSAQKQRKQKKVSGSVIKKVPEELRELWETHIVERSTVLQAYGQQLAVELERLEKEVLRATASENEVTSFLHKKIKELNKSVKYQSSQLCRLRGLQQAFHEQLEGLEDGQSNQMSESQQALKKDMYNLRKKILKENQKQEVERIKRSLQAMLCNM